MGVVGQFGGAGILACILFAGQARMPAPPEPNWDTTDLGVGFAFVQNVAEAGITVRASSGRGDGLPSDRDESVSIIRGFAPLLRGSQPCVTDCDLRRSVGWFAIVAVCGQARGMEQPPWRSPLTAEIATDRCSRYPPE